MTEKWLICALSETALSVFTDIFYQSLLPEFTKRCLSYKFCNRLFWISKYLQGNKGECENVKLEFLIQLFKLSISSRKQILTVLFFLHQTEEMSSMTGYFPEQAIIGFNPSKVAFEIRFT